MTTITMECSVRRCGYRTGNAETKEVIDQLQVHVAKVHPDYTMRGLMIMPKDNVTRIAPPADDLVTSRDADGGITADSIAAAYEVQRTPTEQLDVVSHVLASVNEDHLQLDHVEQLRVIQERITTLVRSATRRMAATWPAGADAESHL